MVEVYSFLYICQHDNQSTQMWRWVFIWFLCWRIYKNEHIDAHNRMNSVKVVELCRHFGACSLLLICLAYSLTLKVVASYFCKVLVNLYLFSQCHIPENNTLRVTIIYVRKYCNLWRISAVILLSLVCNLHILAVFRSHRPSSLRSHRIQTHGTLTQNLQASL